MNLVTQRRGFLGRIFGAAAVASFPQAVERAIAAPDTSPNDWIREVGGTHRCLFDFPQRRNGFPLLHILNYLEHLYGGFPKWPAGQVGAVGTLYGIGGQASISLAFNDAMWKKYGLGEYTALKDAAGTPYAQCSRPTNEGRSARADAGHPSPTIPR